MMKFGVMLFLGLAGLPAVGQGVRYNDQVMTTSGIAPPGVQAPLLSVPNAKVYVCSLTTLPLGSGCTQQPVFTDQAMTIPVVQPMIADTLGMFGFYVTGGSYGFAAYAPAGDLLKLKPFSTSGSGGGGSYTFTPPLALAGSVVSIPPATGSAAGALAASDWTAFNGKDAGGAAAAAQAAAIAASDPVGSAATAQTAAQAFAANASNISSGTVASVRLPVFIGSGSTHAVGAVPDAGSSAGSTRFLREDGTWVVPSGGSGSGTVNSGSAFSPAYYPTGGGAQVSGATPFSGFGIYSTSAPPRAGVAADFTGLLSVPGAIGGTTPAVVNGTVMNVGATTPTGTAVFNMTLPTSFTAAFGMNFGNSTLDLYAASVGVIKTDAGFTVMGNLVGGGTAVITGQMSGGSFLTGHDVITTPSTITASSTPAINAVFGLVTITLNANAVATVSGISSGARQTVEICQPATGGPFTWTWPSAYHSGMTIGTTASTCSIQSFNSFNGTTFVPESPGITGVAP